MIQRIQTVFLLLAIGCMTAFLLMPLITTEPIEAGIKEKIESGQFEKSYSHKGYQIYSRVRVSGEPYLVYMNAILSGTALGFMLISIFLFMRRKLQMAVCGFALLFVATAQAYVYYEYQTYVYEGWVDLTPWNLLSLGAALFCILAIAYIRKDEALIKSLDRLR